MCIWGFLLFWADLEAVCPAPLNVLCLPLGSTLPLSTLLCVLGSWPVWIASSGLLCPHLLLGSAKGKHSGRSRRGGEWGWGVYSLIPPCWAVGWQWLHPSTEDLSSYGDRPHQTRGHYFLSLSFQAWGWEGTVLLASECFIIPCRLVDPHTCQLSSHKLSSITPCERAICLLPGPCLAFQLTSASSGESPPLFWPSQHPIRTIQARLEWVAWPLKSTCWPHFIAREARHGVSLAFPGLPSNLVHKNFNHKSQTHTPYSLPEKNVCNA